MDEVTQGVFEEVQTVDEAQVERNPLVAANGSGLAKYSSLVVRNSATSPSSCAEIVYAGSIPIARQLAKSQASAAPHPNLQIGRGGEPPVDLSQKVQVAHAAKLADRSQPGGSPGATAQAGGIAEVRPDSYAAEDPNAGGV